MTISLSDRGTLSLIIDGPKDSDVQFKWNVKAQRYQYIKGGQFVPKEAFKALTEKHIATKKSQLRAIGENFANEGGFVAFQKDGWENIKTTFAQQYALGRGGIGRMTDEDKERLEEELVYQRKMWKGFAKDIKTGTVSPAQMQARLAMYGEASKVAFCDGREAAAIAAGMTEELNVMNAEVENCEGCQSRTKEGWKPIGSLGRITKDTECRIFCHCTRSYRKGPLRKDAILPGLIKKKITNKQGEQQTVYVRPEDKTNAIAKKHVAKTLLTDELPERKEFLELIESATADFFRNPIKAIDDGFKRERLAREAYSAAFGQEAPTKMQVTAKALKAAGEKLKKFALSKDTAVNTAGFLGSIAGGAVGGPAGQLAGDLGGALAARKIVESMEAYQAASDKLNHEAFFQSASALSKLKIKGSYTLSELKSAKMQQAIEKELVGDTAGWAVGNGAAFSLSELIPPIAGIPMKGAAVAMATVPTIVTPIATKAHELRRNGATPQEAVIGAFSEYIEKGNEREAKMRAEFTKSMRSLKNANEH